MPRERMQISWDDLKSETVEKKLQQQEAIVQAREHYDSAQIAAVPTRKPRFTFIYNTVFYMGLFGALGGLVGWGFGILLHLRPNPQQEARTLIGSWEQFEKQRAQKIADIEMVQKQMDPAKRAALDPEKAVANDLAEKQKRGLMRDGHDNDYFKLYVKHEAGELDDQRFTSLRAQFAERDDWKNFIANLLF